MSVRPTCKEECSSVRDSSIVSHMSLSAALFVRNKNDDFICNISLSPSPLVDDLQLTKLVITSYTRDPAIIHHKDRRIVVSVVDGVKNKHFDGFVQYLFDRKKAAEATLPNGVKFYLLPPDSPSASSLFGITPSSTPVAPAEKCQVDAQKKSVPATTNAPKKTLTPASSSGGFLNSLLGKVDNSAASRIAAPDTTPQINALQALQERISAELAAFVADTAATMKAFEPMEREQRQIVHDATNDFSDVLISSSLGDDIDRHVVVYKRGHEPQDVEFFAGMKQAIRPTIRRKTPTTTSYKPLDIKALDNSIQAINTVKRDRRTIEEVQQTLKKRKIEEHSGESNRTNS